jgi:hypothetical protein
MKKQITGSSPGFTATILGQSAKTHIKILNEERNLAMPLKYPERPELK